MYRPNKFETSRNSAMSQQQKTGIEALSELTSKDIETLSNASRYNTNAHEICKCIMILVYTEKVNNDFGHFQKKVSNNTDGFLKFIKTIKRHPV